MQNPNLVDLTQNMVNVIQNRGNFSPQAFSNNAVQINVHTEVCKLELNVSFVYEEVSNLIVTLGIHSKQKMTSVGG